MLSTFNIVVRIKCEKSQIITNYTEKLGIIFKKKYFEVKNTNTLKKYFKYLRLLVSENYSNTYHL